MILQHVTLRLVQPRDDDQLVTDLHAQQGFGKLRFDLEPRVRRAFRSLPGRLFPPLQRRTNEANRLQCVRAHFVQCLAAGTELIVLVFEKDIERRERTVTAGDILLQVELVGIA